MSVRFARLLGSALVAWIALGAGCGLSLKEQAGEADGLVDAGMEPDPDATPGPVCSNGRVVYLHFSGLTLNLADSGETDATLNRASWLGVDSANVPAYKVGDANREIEIQQITAAIRLTLGAFPITVVIERPVAGPYSMVVFGGRSQALGNNNNVGALSAYDCQNRVRNDVVWIGERFQPQDSADFAVGGIGLGVGLAGTLEPGDCLCGWGNTCAPLVGAACTLSSQIVNDGGCDGNTRKSQDEIAAFRKEFCEPLPAP
jgi:hypothetical protein